jgi:Arc/MetJ-type ribon-helix-helix transcriptional regulator
MKRITVSLPDELVERIKRVAGEGQVSAYVAAALAEYQERETLDLGRLGGRNADDRGCSTSGGGGI